MFGTGRSGRGSTCRGLGLRAAAFDRRVLALPTFISQSSLSKADCQRDSQIQLGLPIDSLCAPRCQATVHGASEPLAANQDDLAGADVPDVRRAGMFDEAETLVPGANWRDPAAVAMRARDVTKGKEIVVYCVYGRELGQATALRLRAQGAKFRFCGVESAAGERPAGR